MGVVAEGGYGTGVNPTGTDFPFIREVAGAERLFSDMYLGHRVESAVLPLRVTDISGFQQPPVSSRADILVVDANDDVVFDSTTSTAYRYVNWSSRFRIHEWLTSSAVCRVVQHTGQNDLEDVIVYPSSQTLSNAILDERVSELWPKEVTKIIVNGNQIQGNVEIVGGYNFNTSLYGINKLEGSPHVNSIFVGAPPGGGEGLTPGCEEEATQTPPVRRINQIGPSDTGAFSLMANECLWLTRPGTVYTDGNKTKISFDLESINKKGMMLKNNCLPCCSCNDFVNTYKAIRRLYDTYSELGSRSAVLRDQHAENITRWLAQKTCRESSPVKISLLPFSLREDSCVKVAVGICNSYEACRGELEVDLNFQTPTGLAGYINPETVFVYDSNGSKAVNYTLEGTWPDYRVRWDVVESQRLAKIKFDVVFARTPQITWDGYFSMLDGPHGNVVLDGRFIVMYNNVISKSTYALMGTVNYVDAVASLASGYRVETILEKRTRSTTNVIAFMGPGATSPMNEWRWSIITNPSSSSVKPYSLRVIYDKTGTWGSKYTGRLYTDVIIPPTFGPKVVSGDYVTLNVDAKLNEQPLDYGTASETVGLKVS